MSIDTLINEYYYSKKGKISVVENDKVKEEKIEVETEHKIHFESHSKKNKFKDFMSKLNPANIPRFLSKIYIKTLQGLSLFDRIIFIALFLFLILTIIYAVECFFKTVEKWSIVLWLIFSILLVILLIIRFIIFVNKKEMLRFYQKTLPEIEEKEIMSLRLFLKKHGINDEDNDVIDFIIQECMINKESYDSIKEIKKAFVGFLTILSGFLTSMFYKYVDSVFKDADSEKYASLIKEILGILLKYKALFVIVFFGILVTMLSIVLYLIPDIVKFINRKYSFYEETIGVLKQIKLDNSINKKTK